MDGRLERLKQAREHAGFKSARAAALHFGWKESTYRAHENNGRTVSRPDINRYAEAYGVSADWIWSGKGQMVSGDGERPRNHTPNARLGPQEVIFPERRLPVYGLAMAGKSGALLLENRPVDQADCPPNLTNVPGAYAVYVFGDSMEHRYYEGETVFVHPTKPPRKGDFVVAQIQRESEPVTGYVKRFDGWRGDTLVLSQFNPPEELLFHRSEVRAVHRIVGTSTT